MKTKTVIYSAVVGVGLIALVVDRCFLGATAPQSSAAGEPGDDIEQDHSAHSQSAPPSRRRPAVAAAAGKISVPELHFPRNLPTFDSAMEMRDLFQRPGIAPVRGGKASAGQSGDDEETAIGRESFAAVHHVDGVFVQERLKIAIVNGKWVREGEKIDECTLLRIEGDSAVFQCHDGDTVLSPARKSASGASKD